MIIHEDKERKVIKVTHVPQHNATKVKSGRNHFPATFIDRCRPEAAPPSPLCKENAWDLFCVSLIFATALIIYVGHKLISDRSSPAEHGNDSNYGSKLLLFSTFNQKSNLTSDEIVDDESFSLDEKFDWTNLIQMFTRYCSYLEESHQAVQDNKWKNSSQHWTFCQKEHDKHSPQDPEYRKDTSRSDNFKSVETFLSLYLAEFCHELKKQINSSNTESSLSMTELWMETDAHHVSGNSSCRNDTKFSNKRCLRQLAINVLHQLESPCVVVEENVTSPSSNNCTKITKLLKDVLLLQNANTNSSLDSQTRSIINRLLEILNYPKKDRIQIKNKSQDEKTRTYVEENFLDEAFQKGLKYLENQQTKEDNLFKTGIRPPEGSATEKHQIFLRSQPQGSQCPHHKLFLHARINLTDSTHCRPTFPYRRIDGRCNNLQHPEAGGAFTPYRRLLPPDYADGVSQPRTGLHGQPLPSTRLITSKLFSVKKKRDCSCTLMTMLMGLFVDHDLTNTATSEGKDGSFVTCCDEMIQGNKSLLHPECYPIKIPHDDPFFGPHNVTCMNFVRASPVGCWEFGKNTCRGQRQQLNQITSFLDGSSVYGSTDEQASQLRTYKGGMLKSSIMGGREMLPMNKDKKSSCGNPEQHQYCFISGDSRTNEHVNLMVMHAIWMREHNRIAKILQELSTNCSDEIIFQEARRIVTAEIQHITYNEYLPLLLGKDIIQKNNLTLVEDGYFSGYDDNVDASLNNNFAAAAFRFGHSQVREIVPLANKLYVKFDENPIHWTFFNPATLYEVGFDAHVTGALQERSQSVDHYVNPELRNRLFQSKHGSHGLDLSAYSIQRGRDHGLPGYTSWRDVCNQSAIDAWEDLHDIMSNRSIRLLKQLYRSVHDIDLIPGALSERHLPGALVGPTHACLIAEQFYRTRVGDRFWYENGGQSGSFTEGQLSEIRKVTLSRILCDNSDNLNIIQLKAFMLQDKKSNPAVSCNDEKRLPKLNMEAWSGIC
ncbi:salivary peroxidase/catechol oxidase-like [Tachypleus tridentatus]|uniref:salivary peroxidase/catechol oxidase-like n=1 Tax=Tachypleus tridentatus TaxID=6853 RepID=UPI003FD43139